MEIRQFDGMVAVVSGGSRGIGRAVVEELSAGGSRVFFTYNRHEKEAQAVAQSSGAIAIRCDQREPGAVDAAVAEILSGAGQIDILVNNASITADAYCMVMNQEQWDAVLETNCTAAFRWVKNVSRSMISRHCGSIINIASVAALVGGAGQCNYAASKGALLSLSRALAAELGPKGVRVNAVVPGYVATDMTALLPAPQKRFHKSRILLRRFADPQEISHVVCFLASSLSSYIIGQAIVVDGGLTTTVYPDV
ncbi:MAG: SDR family oxidoreductase [Chitinivibrionales bacterium]|nr:SDR family oxidoreductase [Chitinivibrionales bacterium]